MRRKLPAGSRTAASRTPPDGDPNMYSFYYPSRYDMRVPGAGRRACDHMRAGCPSMRPDGLPPDYDYFEDATKPDGD